MNPSPDSAASSPGTALAATAAEWVMRQDRGLSPEEQDAFLHWLATDPRHSVAMSRQRRAWEAFDRLAGLQSSVQTLPDPDLLAPAAPHARRPARWRFAWVAAPLAAAAAVAFAIWSFRPGPPASREIPPNVSAALALVNPIEERVLADGSTVRLNRGAVVTVEFLPGERRVRLERGEAAFDVAKNATRPFVVVSSGVSVRAVGTAFNVRLGESAVEVIVTEGRVAVVGDQASPDTLPPTVDAGQRAVVPLTVGDSGPAVSTLSPDDLSRRLAWQPRMLSFSDEPLAAILKEFNRHNPITLRLGGEPALQGLRLTARFRSDNVEGFLRLLASDFGVKVQPGNEDEVLLRLSR
ncbi:MAG: FecR domain-containing protein [Opitutaceae bacterium]|nr:FecR domain-containing protein [Opitutaceae bacterium]